MDRLTLPPGIGRSPVVRVALVLGAIASIGFGGLHVWSSLLMAELRAELDAQSYPRCAPPSVLPDGTVPAVVREVRKRAVSNEEILFEGWAAPQALNIENVQGWLVRFRMSRPERPGCDGNRIAIYSNNNVQIIVTPEEFDRYARERGAILP